MAALVNRAVLPCQVLGEVLRLTQRRWASAFPLVCELVDGLTGLYLCPPTRMPDLKRAALIARQHRLQVWDSVVIAVSAGAGADLLLTEDMQDGQIVSGVRLLDPFRPQNARAVETLLSGRR